MKREDLQRKLVMWRIYAIIFALCLAAQSFNIVYEGCTP